MTPQDRQPAAAGGEIPVAPGESARPEPGGFAISPAVGGLPRIYVPLSPGAAGTSTGLWRATVRVARWALRRVSRRLTQYSGSESAAQGGTMTDFPAELRYSTDHLWVRSTNAGGTVRIGVTDFAQVSLGDVVDVTLPRVGEAVTAGEPCGAVESTKSVNDLMAPVTGTVTTRNDDLADNPDQVNTDPYGKGWMFEIDADPAELSQQLAALMDAGAYRQQVGE
jgi:glycine cleavage system H protein